MNINIRVKPVKHTAPTKQELLRKMKMHGWSIGSYGNTHNSSMLYDGAVRVYTCEKRRRKTVQSRKPGSDKTTSVVVRNAYWVGYVYTIPTTLLDAAKLKVNQQDRTFKLVARK